MHGLQIFKNGIFEVEVKSENGESMFDVETVARSLGFTEVKDGKVYVRWRTVNGYLKKYLSQDLAKSDFISEAMVYKLAFKASNYRAEQFQDWLAVEVLPQIRKTGTYQAPMSIEDMMIRQLNEMKLVKTDIEMLKDSMRISGSQEFSIKQAGNVKAIECLGGRDSHAYSVMSKKVFAQFWRDFKKFFKIPRYGELLKADYERGLSYIKMWQPDTATRIEIDELNSQKRLDIA